MRRQDELRKLPAGTLSNVVDILETNNDWQKFMSLIPKDFKSEHFEVKYNYEHLRIIEEYGKKTNRKCAEILFDEWGTSGRIRPTLDNLMNLLVKAGMYRAADEVARILEEPIPNRPNDGVGALITISITGELDNLSMEQRLQSIATITTENLDISNQGPNLHDCTTKQMKDPSNLIQFSTNNCSHNVSRSQMPPESVNFIEFSKSTDSKDLPDFDALLPKCQNESMCSYNTILSSKSNTSQYLPNLDILHEIDNDILYDKNLVHFEYTALETMTNRFSETFSEEMNKPVGKIGSGGFGEVFVGTHKLYGHLAVKRVRNFSQINYEPEMAIKLFNTEVKSLAHLRHENVVPILGYSLDGPTPCIVCKYIDGGSLDKKIAAKVLNEHIRINIMKGTAEGLKYIHKSERPLQSENHSVSQKKSYYLHGDVKSANILLTRNNVPKLCDFGLAKQLDTTIITKFMKGTSAYMAPEGFSGTVTQKNDIYSYGIVLLELLTGLKAIVTANGENTHIKTYVEENCLNGDITGLLDPVVHKWSTAEKVYDLANHCLIHDKNKRLNIDEVCNILDGITPN